MVFKNREEAAKLLAQELKEYNSGNSIVVALPRGGVPLGIILAKELNLPFEIFFVKKIPSPYNKEVAIGAVSENGLIYLNKNAIKMLNISKNEYIESKAKEILANIQKKRQIYNKNRLSFKDKNIILVDDGIATGSSYFLAIEALKKEGAKSVVAVSPVAPLDTALELEKVANSVVILNKDPNFMAVGAYYKDFHQLSDDEVKRLLQQ